MTSAATGAAGEENHSFLVHSFSGMKIQTEVVGKQMEVVGKKPVYTNERPGFKALQRRLGYREPVQNSHFDKLPTDVSELIADHPMANIIPKMHDMTTLYASALLLNWLPHPFFLSDKEVVRDFEIGTCGGEYGLFGGMIRGSKKSMIVSPGVKDLRPPVWINETPNWQGNGVFIGNKMGIVNATWADNRKIKGFVGPVDIKAYVAVARRFIEKFSDALKGKRIENFQASLLSYIESGETCFDVLVNMHTLINEDGYFVLDPTFFRSKLKNDGDESMCQMFVDSIVEIVKDPGFSNFNKDDINGQVISYLPLNLETFQWYGSNIWTSPRGRALLAWESGFVDDDMNPIVLVDNQDNKLNKLTIFSRAKIHGSWFRLLKMAKKLVWVQESEGGNPKPLHIIPYDEGRQEEVQYTPNELVSDMVLYGNSGLTDFQNCIRDDIECLTMYRAKHKSTGTDLGYYLVHGDNVLSLGTKDYETAAILRGIAMNFEVTRHVLGSRRQMEGIIELEALPLICDPVGIATLFFAKEMFDKKQDNDGVQIVTAKLAGLSHLAWFTSVTRGGAPSKTRKYRIGGFVGGIAVMLASAVIGAIKRDL